MRVSTENYQTCEVPLVQTEVCTIMVARVLKDHMALSTPVEKDRNGLMPVSSTPLKLWRSAVHKEPCGRRTDLSQAGVAFYLAYKQGKNAAYILQRRVEHTPG